MALPPETLERHVNALSDTFEALLAPKPVWKSSKMGEGVMDRMIRMSLPVRLRISRLDSTWKLNQNKTAEARAGVITALAARGEPDAALARAMRDLSDL